MRMKKILFMEMLKKIKMTEMIQTMKEMQNILTIQLMIQTMKKELQKQIMIVIIELYEDLNGLEILMNRGIKVSCQDFLEGF